MKKIKLLLYVFMISLRLIAQPTVGLVGYFSCNNILTNTGSLNITATNNNTVFSTNRAGTANSALQFNGSLTSFLSLTDNGNLDFTDDFTVSMGVYLSSLASSQGIYDNCLNYGGYGLFYFNGPNTLQFNCKNGSIAATGFGVNQWKAVTFQRSGTTMKIFIDGVLAASGVVGSQVAAYNYPPVVGQMFFTSQSANGNYNPISNGSKIDEMRFYNRALSDAEIISLTPFTLPSSIINFTASLKNSNATLYWDVFNSNLTKEFNVEQSIDGINFKCIATITTLNNNLNFSYTDSSLISLAATTVFYRLKQHDLNGISSYSKTLSLNLQIKQKSIILYPNPVLNEANINLYSSKPNFANIILINNVGKIVLSKVWNLQAGNNATSLNLASIGSGSYWLKVIGNEVFETHQIVKK